MNKPKHPAQSGLAEKLPRKIYERELGKLHVDLVLLQKWIVDTGQKARQPSSLSRRCPTSADRT